ncbi:MAG: hydrogenase maturation protease [Verrucomicrobiota bacterium]
MNNLHEQLEALLAQRTCVIGLGNAGYGDDAIGVRLAETLSEAGREDVCIAGTSPERWLPRLAEDGFAHLLLVDTVDFGGNPGDVVLLDSAGIQNRYPQVSTHKLSLGLLARMVESQSRCRVWLLGIQPQSLQVDAGLSPALQTTLESLLVLMQNHKILA